MNLFHLTTKISEILMHILYAPLKVVAFSMLFVSNKLIDFSIKKYGHISGIEAKIGLRFQKRANIMIYEMLMESTEYVIQLDRGEIMKAIDAKKAYPYICKSDRKLPKEQRTTFMCRYIDPYLDAKLGDQLFNISGSGNSRKERLLTGTQRMEILQGCVKGWENFKDENDALVKFDEKNIEGMIAMIPPPARAELADFIRGESDLDEGEG